MCFLKQSHVTAIVGSIFGGAGTCVQCSDFSGHYQLSSNPQLPRFFLLTTWRHRTIGQAQPHDAKGWGKHGNIFLRFTVRMVLFTSKHASALAMVKLKQLFLTLTCRDTAHKNVPALQNLESRLIVFP